MHTKSLASAAAVAVMSIASACGGSSSLAQFTLSGGVFDVPELDASSPDITFFDATPQTNECPKIDVAGVTLNGDVVPAEHVSAGGLVSFRGPIEAPQCGTIGIDVRDELGGDVRDGELVIDSGGDVVRYVGTDLFGARHATPVDIDESVPRGLPRRFRHEPASDTEASDAFVSAFLGEQERSVDAFLDANGEIVVTVPNDAPVGDAVLTFALSYTVPTAACENLRECAVTATRRSSVDITIR